MTENGARPDAHAPKPNSYYFPPASYGAAPYPYARPDPYAQPAMPQGYRPPGRDPRGPAMPPMPPMPPQAGHYRPAPPPGYGPPAYPYSEPPARLDIEDAVAQIAARMHALDGDPSAARPFVPSSPPPLPPEQYHPAVDPYAPPHARQQPYAPPLVPSWQPEPARYPEPPRYPEPQPGPDLSGLESQIRNLTAQIETLRQPAPDFSGALRELREDLAEISNRLMEAVPRHAIEALEAEVRRLAERIDISRAAGVDPDAIAGMERSLADVRDAIRSLKPAESLAGFEQAIRNLSDRIDQSAGLYQDPASLQQLESSIGALRNIVANVASNDTLAGLSEEIKGLSAKVERVAATSKGIDADMLHSIEQRIASLPVLGAIERGFADLTARLDAIQIPAPQPVIDPTPAVDHLKRDLIRTQDSLEAVHSTLGHLVDRLAIIEGGIREARFAAEAPAPMPAPTPMLAPAPAPMPAAKLQVPLSPSEPPVIAAERPRMPEPSNSPPQVAPRGQEADKPVVQNQSRPDARPKSVAAEGSRPVAAAATQTPQAAPTASRGRERNPIDSSLPPDFPLEPGSGTPRARPPASAAERIAASEAAIGNAKPGGANHPGQTNFIAAARRAAQAAAATAPEAAGKPDEGDKSGKSIGQKVRSLFVGAGAIILVVASARVAIDMLDPANQSVAEITAPAALDVAETPETQPAPTIAAPAVLPSKPEIFATPSSGVIVPERSKVASPTVEAPVGDPAPTGSIGAPGKRIVPEPALARGPIPPLPDKLPLALRNAARKGEPAAEFEVGVRQIEGRGVPQNTEAGLRWLERAAESGLAPAHFRLAGLYEKGQGVRKDLSVARRHYIAAAEKGNAKAMHNLAVLYAEGVDGKADYKTAAQWFRRAAERGVADSQYNLAILHARGIGVDQNLAESYMWFSLAAVQGDRDAAKKRDDVGSKLDAGSLAAARSAVQSFTAQPQPDDAVTVSAPPGGWDRPAAETAPGKKPRAGSVVKVTAS
ncbi:hypothetical protein [Pseudorhodoplanes sp.]|uniref:tetratricopeptide repeat protein n=1 Tax=Pseudorhodoplanes sp. TaxID=1934341 RepID=UPI003D1217CB